MNDAPTLQLDAQLFAGLYAHQAAALHHLLQPGVSHYALLWEMGVGKTAVAVRYGATLLGQKIYCCPASCKEQVAREIRRFAPGARVQILHGQRAQLDPDADWCVISYGLLLNDSVFRQLIDRRWPLLVLDESHLLRTPSAKRTRRVFGRAPCLAGQADHVLALSGTPVVNSPLDVFPLANRVFPRAIAIEDASGKLRRMQQNEFEDKYCVRRPRRIGGGRTIEVIVGGKNLADLGERLAPHVSRLRRAEVLDLPPITINDYALTVELGDALADATANLPPGLVQALQRAGDDDLPQLLRRHAAELATLRRLLGTLKAPAAATHIIERLDGGEDRVIAFFHHKAAGDIVLDQLHNAGVTAAMVRGDTPAGARTRAIDAMTDGNVRVLLLQNEAGSLGLNLQKARCAIVIEPSWTDATTQQAIGRIYRAGQVRSCVVEFLLLANSLDEHVIGVAHRKAMIAAQLIENPQPQIVAT